MRKARVKKTRNHGKRGYLVNAIGEDGRRKRRFFQDKNLAQDFADQCNRESVKAFNIDEPLKMEAMECEKKLRASGWTLTQATDYALRHAVIYTTAPPIRDLVDQFLAEEKERCDDGQIRQKSLDDLCQRLGQFKERFGHRKLHEITKEDLQEWNAEMRTDGSEPLTRRHYLTKAGQLFNWAIPKYCERNPVGQIRLPRKAQEEIEFFTVDACKRLLQFSDAVGLRHDVALGMFLGIRPGELERLRPKYVNIAGRIIRLEAPVTKMSQRRVIELKAGEPEFDAVIAWLDGLPVPENIAGDRGNFEALKEKAGVDWVFDGLRRSACTYHIAQHNDPARTAFLLGHSSPRTLQQHYLGLATRAEADEFYAIRPRLVGGAVSI